MSPYMLRACLFATVKIVATCVPQLIECCEHAAVRAALLTRASVQRTRVIARTKGR